MKIINICQKMYTFVILNIVFGFQFISVFPDLFNQSTRENTIPYRIFTLSISILAILLFLNRRHRIFEKNFFIQYLFFWALIFFRLFYDLEIRNIQTSINADYYWMFAFGGIFIPTLVLFFNIPSLQFKRIHSLGLLGLLVTCILNIFVAIFVSPNSTNLPLLNSYGLSTHVLSPITYGQTGVTLILFATTNFPNKNRTKELIYRILCIILGLLMVAFSSSRGPIISLLICFSAMIITRSNIQNKFMVFALLIFLGLSLYFVSAKIEENTSIAPLTRFSKMIEINDDLSISNRLIRYEYSINQFMNNPLIGDSMVVFETGDYPHNILIEVLLAFGIFGEILFLIITFKSMKSAYFLLRRTNIGWIGLVYIQFFVGALFSGSLFTNGNFWFWTVLSIITYKNFSINKYKGTESICAKHESESIFDERLQLKGGNNSEYV